MNEHCNICFELSKDEENVVDRDYYELIAAGENILYENEAFSLIPSFGPLNHSHAMLVPKKHVNNFASLHEEEKKKTREILDFLREFYRDSYQEELVFFESGAGNLTNHSGGCITHAHIHCISYTDGFDELLFDEINLEDVGSSGDVDLDYGYVWFQSINGGQYVCNNPLLPSQFLRYLYSKSYDGSHLWNWRRNIDIDGVRNVIERYRGLKAA